MAFRDEGTDQAIAAAPQEGESPAEIVAAEPAAADSASAVVQSTQGEQSNGALSLGHACRTASAIGCHRRRCLQIFARLAMAIGPPGLADGWEYTRRAPFRQGDQVVCAAILRARWGR